MMEERCEKRRKIETPASSRTHATTKTAKITNKHANNKHIRKAERGTPHTARNNCFRNKIYSPLLE